MELRTIITLDQLDGMVSCPFCFIHLSLSEQALILLFPFHLFIFQKRQIRSIKYLLLGPKVGRATLHQLGC